MPLQPGDKLGPYEITVPIGKGGMGEVWKAHDPRLNRDVAIKISLEQFNTRFEQEAQAIAALNHPNICQIHDIGPNYLVLEYIEGLPIKGPMAADEVVRLAAQIAEALDAAHRKGVVHRDLKPGNIMLTVNGAVKLLDFGLARLDRPNQSVGALSTLTLGLTEPGVVMGTVAYMSPEQAQGLVADARSDIFAFGLVLYEMLSGRRAFTGDTNLATMMAIVSQETPPFQAPAALERIVRRCLEKLPEQRFQAMMEVREALERATPARNAVIQRPSIAVLPFANMSGDKENEYFSDGLAEEILNALAKIPGLKVIARTSSFAFRGKEQDITKIAEILRVRTVLEGSVRRAGSRVRVTAQLIDATDGSHLWSERYDRELADVFAVQDEIAQAIASALHVKLSETATAGEQYKPSLPAYEALLKARYYLGRMHPDLLPRIKESFEQAIALDPRFALAHSEIGIYFLMMAILGSLPANQALPMVRAHAQKALDLDPSLPEGHAMLGVAAAYLEYNWEEAEKRFRMAMAHQPVSPLVRFLHAGFYLLPTGRAAEAIQPVELALQEDPLNPFMLIHRVLLLAAMGRDEEAVRGLHEMLDLHPDAAPANGYLGIYHRTRGELDQALAFTKKAYAQSPMVPFAIGSMAGLLALTGDTAAADLLIDRLLPSAFGAPRALAIYHWMLGDVNATADWMEKAIDQRDPTVPQMLRQWYGRGLRNTPHWARLMRKLNLPEA